MRPSHLYDWSERALAAPLGTGTSAERHADAEESGGNRVSLIGCAQRRTAKEPEKLCTLCGGNSARLAEGGLVLVATYESRPTRDTRNHFGVGFLPGIPGILRQGELTAGFRPRILGDSVPDSA